MLEHYRHVRMPQSSQRWTSWKAADGRGSGGSSVRVTSTVSAVSSPVYSLDSNGGRDRTRTCDLLRVKYYLPFLFVDGTGTYKHIFDVIIV